MVVCLCGPEVKLVQPFLRPQTTDSSAPAALSPGTDRKFIDEKACIEVDTILSI